LGATAGEVVGAAAVVDEVVAAAAVVEVVARAAVVDDVTTGLRVGVTGPAGQVALNKLT